MPRKGYNVSKTLARHIRSCRHSSGLTLREVEKLSRQFGDPIPASTLSKIEKGQVEPGFVRVRQLMEIYRSPLRRVATLVEIESLAEEPAGSDEFSPEERLVRGMALGEKGQIREAMGWLLPLQEPDPANGVDLALFQRSLVTVSILLQRLGRHRLALDTVEEVFRYECDARTLLSAHLQAARASMELGAREMALAFLTRAEEHLAEGDLRGKAMVLTNRAAVLSSLQEWGEALKLVEQAIPLLEEAGDRLNLLRAVAQQAKLKLCSGDADASLRATRRGLDFTWAAEFPSARSRLQLMAGRAMWELGEHTAGLDQMRQALAEATRLDDTNLQFLAHYHLWKVHLEEGNELRARAELGAARSYLEVSQESSEEAREVRGAKPPRQE